MATFFRFLLNLIDKISCSSKGQYQAFLSMNRRDRRVCKTVVENCPSQQQI